MLVAQRIISKNVLTSLVEISLNYKLYLTKHDVANNLRSLVTIFTITIITENNSKLI